MEDMTVRQAPEGAMSSAEFGQLAGEIARELVWLRGERWESLPGYHASQRKLCGPDGAEVWVRQPVKTPGRVEAHGGYPRTNASAKGETFSCTVAIDRGARAVAKSIAARVLPGYLPALAAVLKYNEAEQAAHETRQALMRELAGILGLPFVQTDYRPGDKDTYTDQLSLYDLPGRVSGMVEASGAGDVVKLHADYVPAQTAREMLAVLAHHAPTAAESAALKLAAIEAHLTARANAASADLGIRLRPQDIQVGGAEILAIINRPAP